MCFGSVNGQLEVMLGTINTRTNEDVRAVSRDHLTCAANLGDGRGGYGEVFENVCEAEGRLLDRLRVQGYLCKSV